MRNGALFLLKLIERFYAVCLIVYFLTLCKIKVRTFNVKSYVVYLHCSVRGHDIPYCWQVQIMHYKDNITVEVFLPFGDIITVQQ